MAKKSSWMIYGANGHSGDQAARIALRRGEHPILAGRNEKVLASLGKELQLPIRVFDLDNTENVAQQLNDINTVLCCAGPFIHTTKAMLPACEKSHTNYIDITGELDVFEWVHNHSERWQAASIVALPGAGFDVVPSDCLAGLLKQALPDANHLRLAFKGEVKPGPGTAKVILNILIDGARVRRNGNIISMPSDEMVQYFPFQGSKEQAAVALSWGDVATAYRSTQIPNIECFIGMSEGAAKGVCKMPHNRFLTRPGVRRFIEKQIDRFVTGPNEKQRKGAHMYLVGEVSNGLKKHRMRLVLKDGANFTPESAVECTLRIMNGEVRPGAWTPASAFGPHFVSQLPEVHIETLAS